MKSIVMDYLTKPKQKRQQLTSGSTGSPINAISELARILRTEGTVVISVPNESMINRIKEILIRFGIFKWLFQRRGNYSEMSERMQDEWHLHTFELKEWLELSKKYFKVTHLRRIPFYWLPLRYVIRLERTGSLAEMNETQKKE